MLIILTPTLSSAPVSAPKSPEANAPSRKLNRFGVGGALGGPGALYSLNLDYYATPNIDIEAGGSYIPFYSSSSGNRWDFFSAFIGVKYAFWGNDPGQRWSPYVGAFATVWVIGGDTAYVTSGSNFLSQQITTEKGYAPFWGGYFPLGIELIAFNGFTFAFEIGYRYLPSSSVTLQSSSVPGATSTVTSTNGSGPWAAVKLGYHF